jgi:hypothetical protein
MKFLLLFFFSLPFVCTCVAQRAAAGTPLVPNIQHDFLKERTLLRWKTASLSAGIRYEKTMLPAESSNLLESNRQYTLPVFYRRKLAPSLFWETGLYAGMGRCSYTENVFFPNEIPAVAPVNELIYGAIAGLSLVVSENLHMSLRYRDTFGTGPNANFGKLRMGWQIRF